MTDETQVQSYPFKYPAQALLMDAASIQVGDRTRKDYGDLDGLAESIRINGLLHPPVVDAGGNLVAGGRRLAAITNVLKAQRVPVLVLEVLDDSHRAILEAEENIRRLAPTWQMRVLGVAKVHEVSKRGAILDSRRWTTAETGELLGMSVGNTHNCIMLARYINGKDQEILKATGIREALQVLIMRKEREVAKLQAAALLSRGVSATTVSPTPRLVPLPTSASPVTDDEFFSATPAPGVGVLAPAIDLDEVPGAPSTVTGPILEVDLRKLLRKGDMVQLCEALGSESVDHILTDPPYGINVDYMDGLNDIESIREEHDVADNVESFGPWLNAMYKVLRANGYLVMFYDMDHHEKLASLASAAGFKVQRWPLIWYKTGSNKNSQPSKNWTKNFEVAMVLRKGNATLLQPQQSSIWAGSAEDLKVSLGHPFVKPYKLWQWILSAIAMRGQTVLDPFAGAGSSTIAAFDYGCFPIAFEKNDAHYDRLVVNVAGHLTKVNPNIRLV